MLSAGAINQTPSPETSQTSAVTATNCRTPLSMISTPMITSGTRLDHRCAQEPCSSGANEHAPAGRTSSRGSMPNWSSR